MRTSPLDIVDETIRHNTEKHNVELALCRSEITGLLAAIKLSHGRRLLAASLTGVREQLRQVQADLAAEDQVGEVAS